MYKITHDLLEDIQVILLSGSPQERLQMASYLKQEYTGPVPEETVDRPVLKIQQDGMEIHEE